ncbi:MAG: anthrone oxygenase family protein [Nostoc sp.]|uniref:anthrone oxygenase family protein n=1 Tax=Nostoc sp. TaxID=1180 RepID=UPI002FF49C0A
MTIKNRFPLYKFVQNIITSLSKWHQPGTIYLLFGSLLYLVETILVTIAFNVPLNDALAIAKPDSTEGANLWARYLTNWTLRNYVRTILSLGQQHY